MAEWVANLGIWWYILFYLGIQLINVILNTFKTIITARATRLPAAVINALTFGFYTLVVALTADISNLWVNMAITVVANLIGVYFSIWLLDKIKKDKLWQITATTDDRGFEILSDYLDNNDIGYTANYNTLNTKVIFNIYSYSQHESDIVKKGLKQIKAKWFIHEESRQL